MNPALTKKCWGEAKWLLLALFVLLFAFCWLRVWLVTLIETPRFAAIIEQVWDKWGRFSPVSLQQLISYPGRVATTFVEPVVVLGAVIWAIARGSDSVSGELGRGTMEMLLAQPVSRLQVIGTQAAITVFGCAALAIGAWSGTYLGIHTNEVEIEKPKAGFTVPLFNWRIENPLSAGEMQTVPMSQVVQARQMVPAAFNLFSLGFCIAGMATVMSSWDRYRWRTIGIVVGVYVVELVIKGLAVSTEPLNWLRHLTFFTAYEPQAFVAIAVEFPDSTWAFWLTNHGPWTGLGPMGYNAILLGIGLACYLIAFTIFCRRDLPAPL